LSICHAFRNPAEDVVVAETVDNDNDDDDEYVTPPRACNKQRCLQKKQTTINPDLSVFGKDGMADDKIGGDKTVDKPRLPSTTS
jgi:hypothetical protein